MTEDLPYKPLYFRPGSLRLAPGSKYSNLIELCQYSTAYMSVTISQMELKFVNTGYFKQLFQNLRPKLQFSRPKLQFSKNRIFVTSHFGTLLTKHCKSAENLLELSEFISFHSFPFHFIL